MCEDFPVLFRGNKQSGLGVEKEWIFLLWPSCENNQNIKLTLNFPWPSVCLMRKQSQKRKKREKEKERKEEGSISIF